jgi:hypothetical protein
MQLNKRIYKKVWIMISEKVINENRMNTPKNSSLIKTNKQTMMGLNKHPENSPAH